MTRFHKTLTQLVEDIFITSQDEHFRSGYDSAFSIRLCQYVDKYGLTPVLDAVKQFIKRTPNVSRHSKTIRECLVQLPHHVIDPEDVETLRLFAESLIQSELHTVVDGVWRALSTIESPKSIPTIERALADGVVKGEDWEELIKELRKYETA